MSALRSSAGPAVWTNGDVELGGHDLRQRGLAEAGRAGEQHVVERLAARRRRRGSRPPSWSFSASWPTNSSSRRGRRRDVELVVGARVRASGCGRASAPGRADRSLIGAPPSARGRSGPRASRPAAPSSSSSASCGEKPRPTRPSRASSRGSSPRVITIGSSAGAAPTFSRSSTTIRSAVRLPIPGTACRRAVSPAATARQQLARRAAGEHGERHLRPDATGRRSAAGTGRAPPRWRSRRAAARRRARSGACAASPACPRAGTWRSVSAETASR